ncbi:MAG: DinB family protein [Ferruginibacter sp.]
MPKPSLTSYPAYFQKYVSQVPEEDLLTAYQNQLPIIKEFLSKITEEKSAYAYADDKWTLKEVLQHIIDTERIFNYRALCISRKEITSLPGFDENDYAANSNGNGRKWLDMVEEFLTVRKGTEIMFKSFTDEMLETSGLSNNNPATVNSIGFTTLGHFYHHKKVIEERYL